MLDAAGNQTKYRYVVYNSDGMTANQAGNYTTTYESFDNYKESTITVTLSIPSTPGLTEFYYIGNGELSQVIVRGSNAYKYLSETRTGKIFAKYEGASKTTPSTKLYVYYNDELLASVGSPSSAEIFHADLPISSNYPGRTSSSYVVREGDTVEKVAQAAWGDSRIWYLIADANGLLPGEPLALGSSLRIPNVVGSTHNNATTFKPYSAEEFIGDTTPVPGPPPPPPKPKKKCGGMASVVMVVVAVVASVFTAGASMALLSGASLSLASAAGVAAVTGGLAAAATVVGTTFGTGALIGGALIGGAVGSAASQLVGKSMGVVDKFSWKQVAVGAVSSLATAGLGYAASEGAFGSTIAGATKAINNAGAAATATTRELAIGYAAQGVFSYAASYAANKVVGLSASFSWRDMAASSLGAMIGGTTVTGRDFGSALLRAVLRAHSKAFIRDKWLGGSEPDYAQVAIDAFGNALAEFMARGIGGDKEDRRVTYASDPKYDGWMASIDQGNAKRILSTDTPSGSLDIPIENAVHIRAYADDYMPKDLGQAWASDSIESMNSWEDFATFYRAGQFMMGGYDFISSIPDSVNGFINEQVGQRKDLLMYSAYAVSNALNGQSYKYSPSSSLYSSIEDKGITATGLSIVGGVVQGAISPLKAFFSTKQDYREIGHSVIGMIAGYGAGRVIGRFTPSSVIGTASHHQTKHLWVENIDGARTIDQAKAIAESHGVYIPDKVKFRPVSDEYLDDNGLDVDAYYGNFKNVQSITLITWRPQPKAFSLTDKDGIFTIFIRESILKSDRAIVAVMEHEISELEGLQFAIAKKGGISAAEYKRLVEPGHKDNLHWEAVDRGDELVREMIKNGF